MRYQDWDVLLFPNDRHVPFQEFKTTAYAVQYGETRNEYTPTSRAPPVLQPLVTCFVPAVDEGQSFTISVHAWNKPEFPGIPVRAHMRGDYFWRFRVIIDGVCVQTETWVTITDFPKVIKFTAPDSKGVASPLGWPAFHTGSVSTREWNAASNQGRIKVEIESGTGVDTDDHGLVFTKIANIVCFSFFPAPIKHLERCGVAYPHPGLWLNPLKVPSMPYSYADITVEMSTLDNTQRKRSVSASNLAFSSPFKGLPGPPPPTPAMGGLANFRGQVDDPYGAYGAYSTDSRSTSAYSSEGLYGYNQQASNGLPPMPLGSMHDYTQSQKRQLEVRMPSDQLQRLIAAMTSPKQDMQLPAASQAMPPPPVPQRTKPAALEQIDLVGGHSVFDQRISSLPALTDARARGESRESDLSMHNGCTTFPICTTEDDQGQIVHSSPALPSSGVKGRKEGSSPTKPRDFMSTILGPQAPEAGTVTEDEQPVVLSSSPAETTGRKRTRAALRSLAINDAPPGKMDVDAKKRVRKASRASNSSSASKSLRSKDVKITDSEDKENMMVLDDE